MSFCFLLSMALALGVFFLWRCFQYEEARLQRGVFDGSVLCRQRELSDPHYSQQICLVGRYLGIRKQREGDDTLWIEKKCRKVAGKEIKDDNQTLSFYAGLPERTITQLDSAKKKLLFVFLSTKIIVMKENTYHLMARTYSPVFQNLASLGWYFQT